jgi:hypothetical protein
MAFELGQRNGKNRGQARRVLREEERGAVAWA